MTWTQAIADRFRLNSTKNLTDVTMEVDYSEDALAVRAFAVARTLQCAGCRRQISIEKSEIVGFYKNKQTVLEAFCLNCGGSSCVGCGGMLSDSSIKFGNTSAHGVHFIWHCDKGRAALIWALLCSYDSEIAEIRQSSKIAKPVFIKKHGRRSKHTGIGYGRDYDYADEHYADFEETADLVPDWGSTNLYGQAPPKFPPLSQSQYLAPSPKGSHGHATAYDKIMSDFEALSDGQGFSQAQGLTYGEALAHDQAVAYSQSPSAQLPGALPIAHDKILSYGEAYAKVKALSNSQTTSHNQAPSNCQMPSYNHANPFDQALPQVKEFSQEQLTNIPSYQRHKRHKPAPIQPRVDPEDQPTARVLAALAALLPSESEQLVPTLFDNRPPAVLRSLLLRSSIMDKAAELLRNSSLEDLTQRYDLYTSLFAFVRILAQTPSTLDLLCTRRSVNRLGHDLLKVSFSTPTRQKREPIDTSQSLSQCINDLLNQSNMQLRNIGKYPQEYQSEESQKLIMLCTSICQCAEMLHPMSQLGQLTAPTPQDPYAWQKGLAVVAVTNEQIFANNHYAKDARDMMNTTQTAKGRMSQLIKEINILEAGLPQNIFVRYGESRMDVMKVIIVGPKDTPYENGLFEFDLLFPISYPKEPPKMFFRTTGGGRVSPNPNLYANGKVCLSLLNTWSGEQWQQGQSTLLQILVSIQSMIFCEDPWCNEPGREGQEGRSDSKRFNSTLYPSTVKYGMLEWIEGTKTATAPPARSRDYPYAGQTFTQDMGPNDPKIVRVPMQQSTTTNEPDIFADIAKKHFEANNDDIKKAVGRWIKDTQKVQYLKKRPGATVEGVTAPAPSNADLKVFLQSALQQMEGVRKGAGQSAWTYASEDM